MPALEQWLWDAACQIRGPLDAPKFKDYILPLIFLKRLNDVFEDEVDRVAETVGSHDAAQSLVASDHRLVRFFLPAESRWPQLAVQTTGLGEAFTAAVRAIARFNPRLQGVIDTVDFNATTAGQRILDDDRLRALVGVLGDPRYRLGLKDVAPDILGRAYEYLLRKFAEGQGQSAGEFYTPPEVARLMARILDPQPGMSVYDPCCGSAGLLLKCHLRLLETHGVQVNSHRELPNDVVPLRVFGQEINPATYSLSRMNAVVHDMEADVHLGDTMRRPANVDASGHLQKFDLVTANPMWNQDLDEGVYRNDGYDRFAMGIPPSSSADWGWVQHMLSCLGPEGRMAIVLDATAVDRGSGSQTSSRERDIRKAMVEADLVEAIVLLPEDLFYNTNAPGIVMVLNRKKRHPGAVLLINASPLFLKGRPKNYLTDDHIARVGDLYHGWKEQDGLSMVVTTQQVTESDFNLAPSRYVIPARATPVQALAAVVEEVEDTRNRLKLAQEAVQATLDNLRSRPLDDYRNEAAAWPAIPFGDAVADIQSGDWGSNQLQSDLVECIVLRATDFRLAMTGDLSRAPRRFLRRSSVERRKLLSDDFLVELSGGSTDQPTGRLLRVTPAIVAGPLPVGFSNFIKRLRLRNDIDPAFFLLYWEYLYYLGATRPYEKRSTGIRNFKLTDFLSAERLPLPSLPIQQRVAWLLASVEDAASEASRHSRALSGAFEVCRSLLLGGSK
jgi:type I restriction enzyme M protein